MGVNKQMGTKTISRDGISVTVCDPCLAGEHQHCLKAIGYDCECRCEDHDGRESDDGND